MTSSTLLLSSSVVIGLFAANATAGDSSTEGSNTSRHKTDARRLSTHLGHSNPDKTKTKHSNVDRGHFKVKSADGQFAAELGGNLMLDAVVYKGDKAKGAGSEVRRARLFTKGTVYSDWNYKMQLDFGKEGASVKDLYLAYQGWDFGKITLGNQKQPFGLEQQTSSKYITFMERSVVAAIQDKLGETGRALSLKFASHGDNWTATTSAHLEDASAESNKNEYDDNGYGLRLTYAPFTVATEALHLGLAYHHENYENGGRLIEAKFRPQTHFLTNKPFSSGEIGSMAESDTYGLEMAVVLGPVSFQTEYSRVAFTPADNSESEPLSDVTAWYAYTSWFLTGESRHYRANSGAFGRVRPNKNLSENGTGAWEIGARYSVAKLAGNCTRDCLGNQGHIATFGLNWYPVPAVRFMLNFEKWEVEDPGDTDNLADEGRAIQLRGQLNF